MAKPRQTPLSKTEKILMIYNEVKGEIKDIEIMVNDEEIGLRSKATQEPAGRVSARVVSQPVENEALKRYQLINLKVDKEMFIQDIDISMSFLEERERRVLKYVVIDGGRMAEICRGMGITSGQGANAKQQALKKMEYHIERMDPDYIRAAFKAPGGVIY